MSSTDFDLPKIQSLTEAYFSSDANASTAILTELTDGLLQGNAGGIKNLVEALGTQLTSPETPIRIKGSSQLSFSRSVIVVTKNTGCLVFQSLVKTCFQFVKFVHDMPM